MAHKKTNLKKVVDIPLAIIEMGNEVWMLARVDNKTTSSLHLLQSDDGVSFVKNEKKVEVTNISGKPERIKICDKFSLSCTPNGYVMTYVRSGNKKIKNLLVV